MTRLRFDVFIVFAFARKCVIYVLKCAENAFSTDCRERWLSFWGSQFQEKVAPSVKCCGFHVFDEGPNLSWGFSGWVPFCFSALLKILIDKGERTHAGHTVCS